MLQIFKLNNLENEIIPRFPAGNPHWLPAKDKMDFSISQEIIPQRYNLSKKSKKMNYINFSEKGRD